MPIVQDMVAALLTMLSYAFISLMVIWTIFLKLWGLLWSCTLSWCIYLHTFYVLWMFLFYFCLSSYKLFIAEYWILTKYLLKSSSDVLSKYKKWSERSFAWNTCTLICELFVLRIVLSFRIWNRIGFILLTLYGKEQCEWVDILLIGI